MDQLRKFLEGIKGYSFWLVCLAVCGVVLATAILNARRMSQDRIKLESEINSDVAKIEKVQKTTAETGSGSLMAHPNRYTIEGMNSQIKLAAAEALEAWNLRYKSQSPAFVWPKDLLGATAAKFIAQPIPERFLPTGKLVDSAEILAVNNNADDGDGEEISTITSQELDKYAQVIYKRMPQLADIISAKWAFDPDAAGNAGQANNSDAEDAEAGSLVQGRGSAANARDGGGVKVEKQVVEWRKGDQERWYQMVTNFKTISRLPTNRPTLPMALYIQQDLWLLESLFRVIKEVNGDADAKDNADIKKIDHIYFGKDALGMSGSINSPNARLLKLAVDQGKKRDLPPASNVAPSTATAAKFAVQANSRDFLHGRYVNGKFEPLASATVRAAIGVDQLSNNAELIVAKRIPFRIAVEMDERKIPKFLAACANSPFRFEVRQVRINRHIPGQTVSADGKEVGGETSQNDGTESASAGRRGAASQVQKDVATRINYDVKVEFYGIVKIYNPVNFKLLQAPTDVTPAQTAAN